MTPMSLADGCLFIFRASTQQHGTARRKPQMPQLFTHAAAPPPFGAQTHTLG